MVHPLFTFGLFTLAGAERRLIAAKGKRALLRAGVILALLLGAATPTRAVGPAASEIPDADPALEQQSFRPAEGWEISLFAADPMIPKPIQMNFDPAGRLWVATSATYPQIKPGQKADDKIIVLEDTDHDGRADKATTFADGLLIPTGVAPGDGGAFVANSTELLHLKDTNGDGRADATRVLFSGFGTEDTHHILHTFRWGPEGLLYMNQSVYIHTHLETPWGVRRLMAGGIWRLRPETLQMDVFGAVGGTPGGISSTPGVNPSSPMAPGSKASISFCPTPTTPPLMSRRGFCRASIPGSPSFVATRCSRAGRFLPNGSARS